MTVEELRIRASAWAIRCLGGQSTYDVAERSRKALEEAAEFAQAVGVSESQALRIVLHVYNNKPGEIKQELAGLFLTILAASTATGFDLAKIVSEELDRIENVPQDYIDAKQAQKKAAGISEYPV